MEKKRKIPKPCVPCSNCLGARTMLLDGGVECLLYYHGEYSRFDELKKG